MPWIPLAVAAVGIGTQIAGALSGQSAQKEQQQAQARMENLKAARERTSQIRQARSARAQIEQRGANQGAGGSSSVAGGVADVMGQAYGNIQYIGYEQQTGQAISNARQKELNAQGISSIGKGLTDIGSVFAGGMGDLGKIFDPGTSGPPASSGHDFGAFS